jgi:hypothetical protein
VGVRFLRYPRNKSTSEKSKTMATLKTREYLVKFTVAGARGVDAQKTVQAVNVKTAIKTVQESTPDHMEPEITRVYELKAVGSTTVKRENSIKPV